MSAPSDHIGTASLSANWDAAIGSAEHLRLVGVSVREASGAGAAVVRVVEGATGAGGIPVVDVAVAQDASQYVPLGDGIFTPGGISVAVVAGTSDVRLHFRRSLT